MEISIEREEFFRGLSRVQSIIERRTSLPILSNVHLEADAEGLVVTATDLEVGLKARYDAEVKTRGAITVAAKKLFEIVKELPDGRMRFSLVENDRIEIVAGQAQFHIAAIPADEYPDVPGLADKDLFELPAATLGDMFGKVTHAIGSDDARPYLNGVFLQTANTEGGRVLRAVATDGHRLALSETELETDAKLSLDRGVILPRKGVSELKKAIEWDDEPLRVRFDDRSATFRKGSAMFLVRLIEGEFPDYDAVVPKNNDRIVTFGRDDFAAALRRMAVMSEELGRGVRVHLEKRVLTVSCVNPTLGDAREEMPVGYDGETLEVGFNARYMLDALDVVPDEDVSLAFGDAFSPMLVRAPSSSGFSAVIMPMRL
ncbi:DNA polymerase III subunit beta [bacterium]|nr:DNA polymerase III subunit beta [bacterium]